MRALLNRGSWVWKLDVGALFGCAVGCWDVGDEHVWERSVSLGESFLVSLLRSTSDCDGSAIHVHFAVANLIEPCPCKSVVPRGDALRDGVLEFCSALAIRITVLIARCAGRTAADNGVDDHPFR